MARLRFPGRPGYRFDRLGVRYGADEARNVNDPSLAIVAYIHYGLRQFRELFGESDEEEEFDGFSHRDVRNGEKYLERVTNDLIKNMLNSEDDCEASSHATSTRFSSAKAKLDSLPTSDRTRGRIKNVMRKSYKSLIKEGLVKASKTQISASVKEIQRMKTGKEDDKHKKIVRNKRLLIGQRKENIVKIKKSAIKVKLKLSTSPRPRGRPPRDRKTETEAEEPRKPGRPKKLAVKSPEKPARKKIPLKVVCVPKSKQTDKKLAKQLLEKAKKGRSALPGRGTKSIGVKADRVMNTPKAKKEFVLPTVSSRSSRVIIPNKRFIEEDVYFNKTLKKPKLDKSPEVISPNVKMKDGGSAKKNDSPVIKVIKTPEPAVKGPRKKKNGDFTSPGAISPVLHQKGGNSVSLFSSVVADQAGPKSKKSLIVEGKRQRKPSLKMRMKKGQLPSKVVMQNFLLDVDESSSASHESSQGSSENSSKSVDLFPKSVGAATGVSVFSRSGPMSLPGIRHRSDGKGQDSLAAKRSGDNILRKAKLQLNRVAVNRSKAALARSLKAQMKKEAKLQQKQQKSKFSPQSPTSPLALSPISGSRGFVDMPVSPPPRPLFDNNNLPSPDKPIKEKKSPIKRGSHISPKVMSSLAAKLASPTKLQANMEVVAEEDGGEPPPEGADSKGPRIKHVCRRAAMVLRKPVAKFPSPPSLRLSALPHQEKEKILLEESKAHGEESSDDERTMEEIIRNASTQEATVIKRSPVKSTKAPTPSFPFSKTGRRRKVRCRQCKGCLSEDCGVCVYCRDKPKFGGRSVMKQACIERKCSNPKYAKVTSTFVLRNIKSKDNDPDDDNTQRDGDSRQNFSSQSSYTSNGSSRRLPMVQDGENRTSGASNTPPMSNAAGLDGEKRIQFLAQARKLARTKEKAVTGQKPPSSLIKPISSSGAHRGIIPTIESHRIKADTKTSYCIEEAWQQGVAMAMLAPACVRTVCFLCGSAGKHELIYCTVCCEPFHSFCLEEDERPVDEQLENWCCRRCQFCNVCGHQNHLLRCDRCQCTYHPECLGPSYPTRPSKKNIWVCTKCVKCKSCGATTPGVGTNATWTYDFSLCYDCGRLMDKGNFCPICHKCYSDDDWDSKMIQCVRCESWVHARCEELTDEMYQLLSYLPEDVHYTCRICTSERPAPWERLLRAEFVASLKTVLFNLIGMKCSQHLIKRDERRERCSAEKRKSSPRGNRSPAKSATPISMVTDQSYQQLIDPVAEGDKGETTHLSTTCHIPSTAEVPISAVSQQSNIGEICDRTIVATDTERNIFKLIDECLLSDKIPATLCTEPRLEEEQLRGSVKPGGSDSVSMETESYAKSESKESVGTSAGEMQVDMTLQDEDQELLLYLKSCGESPEKEIGPDLNSGTANTSNPGTNQGGAISENQTLKLSDSDDVRTLSQSNIEKMDTCESLSKDHLDLNDSKNTTSSGETTLTASSPREITLFGENPANKIGSSTPDSSLSLTVQLDSRDTMKANDFDSISETTTMQKMNNETPTKSTSGITTTGTPDSDLSTGKKKKLNRLFPPDFESIREKLDAEKYHSVEEFSEDMVHIIQTALSDPEEQTQMRRKSNNSVRSVFVKQMEKCFPWFNISTCKLWEHNKSLPESMLPGAVLPPSEDHTYAQWLEREEPHLSPQPSPFKRLQLGSVRKSIPMSSLDGDSETSSVVMSDYGGDDLRQCLLCSAYGDDTPDLAGRLLYVNHDDWVHVNCALWSAEVFEETNGTLQNVHIALGRGRQMRCDHCGKSGATVGCCNRGCSANYHFKCARADMCVFQEDKKVYCKLHRAQVDRETVEEGGFHVLRRVCVDAQGRYNKKTWNKGVLPRVLNILIGSCTIESLGYLGPLSDVKGCLLPIDFMCTRVYWSTQDARRRCVYTCKIVEVSPSPISPEMRIRDMRIVHDTTHPDFIPLEKLNIEAQSVLHMLSPASSSDVMIVSSTTTSISCQSSAQVSNLSKTSNSDAVASAENNSQQPEFDLNLLSPNTLKYLGKSDLEKYMSKKPKPSYKPVHDDFGNLSKMVDRLNQAASKSVKRADSVERELRAVSPPSMPRIKRSSSCDIPPARLGNTQNLSPVSVPAPRPASVAAMPIRIKVKLRSVSPIDQPISIAVGPQTEVACKNALMTRPDIVTIDEEGPEPQRNQSQKVVHLAREVQEESAQDDSLLMSPEQQLAKVLDSVPPEILESSDGQTVVIMTNSEDISEEEALMLAQAALEQGEEALKEPEEDQGLDVIDLSKQEEGTDQVPEEQRDSEPKRNPEAERKTNTEVTDDPVKDKAADSQGPTAEVIESPKQNVQTVIGGTRTANVTKGPKRDMQTDIEGPKTTDVIEDPKQDVQADSGGPRTAEVNDNSQNDMVKGPGDSRTAAAACKEIINVTKEETDMEVVEAENLKLSRAEETTKHLQSTNICDKNEQNMKVDGDIKESDEQSTKVKVKTDTSTQAEKKTSLEEGETETKEPPKSEAVDTEVGRNPTTPEKEENKQLGVQNVEKKNLSPTRFNSGTIDRSVVEQSPGRKPVYKNGVLIGWRISLDENSTADESGKIVSPDGKKESGSPRGRTRRKSSRQSLTLDDLKPEGSGCSKTSQSQSENLEEVMIGADVIKTEALEMDTSEQDNKCKISQGSEEKTEEETPTANRTKKGSAPLKTYPLRRTSQRLDHGTEVVGDANKDPHDLPLHDKIAQKIKAESLAKSSPGVKGPFKCLTCKRLYRTKESFNTHVQNCDFEVSTSEEEEEEEQKRYPVRSRHKSLEGQGCVVKLTDISKDAKYKLAEKDLSPPVKRGRGRPPKIKKIVPSRKEEKLDRSVDVAERVPEPKTPKRVLRGSSHTSPLPKSDCKHGGQTKRLLSPEDTTVSNVVSPEQSEPPAKRSRGRPPVRKESPELVVKSPDADDKTSPRLFVKLQRDQPKRNCPSADALEEDIDILKSPEGNTWKQKHLDKSMVSEENSSKGEDSSKGDKSSKGDDSSKPAITPQKCAEVEEQNMSPEFRLCEVTGMMKNKSGKLADIETSAENLHGISQGKDDIKNPKKTLKTVFNLITNETDSPGLISDFDTHDSTSEIGHGTKSNRATVNLKSLNIPQKSAEASKEKDLKTFAPSKVAEMVSLPRVSVSLSEEGKSLTKKCEDMQKQIQQKFVQTAKIDPCSHFIDKEKSTKKVQYYMVYPPEDKNIVNKEMRTAKQEGKVAKLVENTGQEKITSTKIAQVKSKVETQRKQAPKTPRANVIVNPIVKPSTSSAVSYSNCPVASLVQSFPQPLMVPQAHAVDSRIIRPTAVQQRNIFEALQSPQGVGLVGTAPIAGVQSSVLESAVAQFNHPGMLPASIQASIHQPQVPQSLTINSSPLPQPSIIPNIIQQSTSTVITAAINSISQPQFQTTPVLQATQSGILRGTLPVSQPTILHQSPTIIQSNLLPAQAPAPASVLMSSNTQVLSHQAAPPNVLVSPNQQVLPTNLISQLGSLLPGQLTPQQATVVSRLNLQNHQQRGMEYMGSFLLDNKSPQNFVTMAQTSPVLAPSLTPQQTQQIMNLVSGSVLNKDLSSLTSALNQNLINSPGVQVQHVNQSHMSSLQAGLGVKPSVVQTKSDTILHSNLVRHLPDGCKTVVCNPSEAVSMLKKILPSSSATKTTVAITSSISTTSQPKPVTSPNLRNMLNDGTNRFQSTSQGRESSMRPYQLTHRPGTHKGFSVLKKILKPAILHRKRNSLTIAAIKRHLALSPEKNGIIQGQISGNIRNSLAIEGSSSDSQPIQDGRSNSSKSKSSASSLVVSKSQSETKSNSSVEQLAVKFQKAGKKKIVVAKTVKKKKKKLEVEGVGPSSGARKRKTPLRVRNIQEKFTGPATMSHPMIHHQKEVMSLPQPEMEEEVRETPMMPYYNVNNQTSGRRPNNESHLMFEITSDDGFKCSGESMEDAWRQVTERVQDARAAARMKAMSYVGIDSTNMFGLNNSTVVYLIEQLYGARHCHKYNFSYFQHDIQHQEEEAAENPSGCIRCEPFTSRKPYDMFSFLMSLYRCKPSTDLGLKNVEMIHKSQRRATSMDLPMAMRFRKLQEHAKEAVGVYRSHIHGRGLFCKRNIDSGEMVIEYAGEVIRASLTDKREKYYESKGIGCYMFRIDDFEVVDATMHGSAARFINHSCEPNCYSRVINVDGKKHIVIFAMRPISKGEELTYDYKFPIEEVKIPCSCGSKKCRKYLN